MLDERATPVVGTPVRLRTGSGARSAANGRALEVVSPEGGLLHLPTDAVIWATGYTTGVSRIEYLLDGKPMSTPPPAGPESAF